MPIPVIGAVASIGGAILGSSAQKKAANTAAQAASDNTAANNALARDIYGQNKATLAPFVNTGTGASAAINALLGIGGVANNNTPVAANYTGQPQLPGVAQLLARNGLFRGEPSALQYGYNFLENQPVPQNDTLMTTTGTPISYTQPSGVASQNGAYQNAFDNYRNSTGYQFRFNEGMKALDNSYASRGVGQSGAAAKAALQYGQNIASGDFGNYLNALMAQQGVGLSAAGAQAGVSTNFVNQTTANNNAAASAAANAAIAKGNATANMWGGIAGGIGNIFGSSFG